MGAQQFHVKSHGKTMSDAYSNAVEDAVDEYGHDPYNGTISTTNSFRDATAEYERSGLSVNEFVEKKFESLNKWDCIGICLKKPILNTNKVKTKVINTPHKGARKWETVYTVSTFRGDRSIGESTFKDEAIKKGRAYTEKTEETTYINLTKRLVKSDSTVAKIEYKKGKEEGKGQYLFFGWASC